MQTVNVPASEVQVEDFLLGIDNGYVVEIGREDERGMFSGVPLVEIFFHTADGDEGILRVPGNVPLSVKRN